MNILITGASVGIGRAISLKYANELNNISLYLLARRKEKLQDLENEIKILNKNINTFVIDCDLKDLDSVKKRVGDLNIDILVNNAGLARGVKSSETIPFSYWEEMIDINIKALAFLINLVLPKMVSKGIGHIVNIGSVAGTYAYPGGGVYGASKAFVEQLGRNLRADLYNKNIRVTNIEPGLVSGSEFSFVRFDGDKQKVDELYDGACPLIPEDIAETVFWVTSLPSRININSIEIMPTTQSISGFNVSRK